MSGIGKGLTVSSLAALVQFRGTPVTICKVDPYLNQDAGTMAPSEHGEVFVLADGTETDLDLGTYERTLRLRLSGKHSMTGGNVMHAVLNAERKGSYLGKTVQWSHCVDHIVGSLVNIGNTPVERQQEDGSWATEVPSVCFVELGGTVGEDESLLFSRAFARLSSVHDVTFLLIVYLPCHHGEFKTKGAQLAIQEARRTQMPPDFLLLRSESELPTECVDKMGKKARLKSNRIMNLPDVAHRYEVASAMQDSPLLSYMQSWLNNNGDSGEDEVKEEYDDSRLLARLGAYTPTVTTPVRIAVVGKYMAHGIQSSDAYLSVEKALRHAAHFYKVPLDITWLDTSYIQKRGIPYVDGIVVPGGFGVRGFGAMVTTIRKCRSENIPFLGICLGLQASIVEALLPEEVKEWTPEHVTSAEFCDSDSCESPSTHHGVIHMDDLDDEGMVGGSMRLGVYETSVMPGTLASECYDESASIVERHRHRYEVNPAMIPAIEKSGLVVTGKWKGRVTIVERNDHPYFIASQFHPEFQSSFGRPAPLFLGLVRAALS